MTDQGTDKAQNSRQTSVERRPLICLGSEVSLRPRKDPKNKLDPTSTTIKHLKCALPLPPPTHTRVPTGSPH
jgi:hypothetical protein